MPQPIKLTVVLISALGLQVINPRPIEAQSSPSGTSITDFVDTDSAPFELPSAINIGLPEPIAEIFQEFTRIVGFIETFLSELGIEVSIGDLGLPELEEVEQILEENNEIDIAGDVFGSQTGSTVDLADKLYQEYLRDLGGEYSKNSALSSVGQEIIVEQIDAASITAQTSQEFAEDSNGQDVSQNILRNISHQLALQQQIDNMLFFETQEAKIARAIELSTTGESLVELSKQTTRSQREASSLFKAGLYHHGLLSVPGQHLVD